MVRLWGLNNEKILIHLHPVSLTSISNKLKIYCYCYNNNVIIIITVRFLKSPHEMWHMFST